MDVDKSTVQQTSPLSLLGKRIGEKDQEDRLGENRLPLKYKTAHPDIYPILKEHAHKNRIESTDAEAYLWEHIRKRALGARFRRQHAIGNYIVDFICLDAKLIIEIDGEYHNNDEQRKEDEIRSDYLNRHGFYVIRFTNSQVLMEIDTVLIRIKKFLSELMPLVDNDF